jgi:hypothetical protein
LHVTDRCAEPGRNDEHFVCALANELLTDRFHSAYDDFELIWHPALVCEG